LCSEEPGGAWAGLARSSLFIFRPTFESELSTQLDFAAFRRRNPFYPSVQIEKQSAYSALYAFYFPLCLQKQAFDARENKKRFALANRFSAWSG